MAGARGAGKEGKIRLCPYIYNSMQDVDPVVAALHAMAKDASVA